MTKAGICGSKRFTKPPSTRVLTIKMVITTLRTGMSIRKAGTSISSCSPCFERATASTTFSSAREPMAHLREPCQPSAAPLHSAGAGAFSTRSFSFPYLRKNCSHLPATFLSLCLLLTPRPFRGLSPIRASHSLV